MPFFIYFLVIYVNLEMRNKDEGLKHSYKRKRKTFYNNRYTEISSATIIFIIFWDSLMF